MHVPLPGSKERGDEQQRGQEWDLEGAVSNPQGYISNPHEEKTTERAEGSEKTAFRLVHLHLADAKVYHIVPLEQRKLCTTLRIYLLIYVLSFLRFV